VDPLREDVNYLKGANASSQQNDKELGDPAESKDHEQHNSPGEVTSLNGRLSDLEVACGVESRLLTHFVERLQKEHAVVQERMNNLEGQLKERLQKEHTVVREQMNNLEGQLKEHLQKEHAVVQQRMNNFEGQLKEVHQESRLEMAITRLHELSDEMRAEQAKQITPAEQIAKCEAACSADVKSERATVAGTVMSTICALESMMARQPRSSKAFVAQSQAQSQVPMTVQANNTSSSESRPAIAHETSPSLSVPLHTASGISSAPKDVRRFLIWDGGSRKDHIGARRLSASRQSEQYLQLNEATHTPQSSCSAVCLHSVKETPPAHKSATCRVPSLSSTLSSATISPWRNWRTVAAGSG